MSKTKFLFFLVLVGSFIFCSAIKAQGIYSDFGQNRIQHQHYQWQKLTLRNIEVYYHGNNETLAKKVLDMSESDLPRLERFLAYRMGGTFQLILFSSLSDYRQSNIGYSNPQFHAGGYTFVSNNAATLYFNGDYRFLKEQVSKCVADLLIKEMLYGGTLQERVQNSALLAIPGWFSKGLSSYLSVEWSSEQENKVRDAIFTGKFKKFNDLTDEDIPLAGHAIWRYLVDTYGPEAITNLIFMTRFTRSVESAILFLTQKGMGGFLHDWRNFYKEKFDDELQRKLPKGNVFTPKRIAKLQHTRFRISSDGKKLAMVTNNQGRYQVWLTDIRTQKTTKLFSGGMRVLNQMPDYNYPIICWKPGKNQLGILNYDKGFYNIIEVDLHGKILKKIPLKQFNSVSDFDYSEDGETLVISAVTESQSDLWLWNYKNDDWKQITSDIHYEHEARFIRNTEQLIFLRSHSETLDSNDSYYYDELMLFDLKNSNKQSLLKTNKNEHIKQPMVYNDSIIGFLSDISGLYNAYLINILQPEKYFAQTDYRRSIVYQDISTNGSVLTEMLFVGNKYVFYVTEGIENPFEDTLAIKFHRWRTRVLPVDSNYNKIRGKISQLISTPRDSIIISTKDTFKTNYIFQTGFEKIDYSPLQPTIGIKSGMQALKGIYETSLSVDFMLSQNENGILGSYYYDNTVPSSIMRNQTLSPLVKISTSDLMRNLHFEGGFRFNFDLNASDFTVRVDYLAHRFDHAFIGYRRSRKFESRLQQFKTNISSEGIYQISYPFDERLRVSFQGGIRNEQVINRLTEGSIFNLEDRNMFYGVSRMQWVFDNTLSPRLNTTLGTKMKAWFESFNGLGNATSIQNLGIDFRHYAKIYRHIIWANRLVGNYSMGREKAVYYLGATENWLDREQYETAFASLGDEKEYPFQHIISNLRGFGRNVRAGSSFILLNSEIRIPWVLMLSNRPLQWEFTRNFSVIGFFDIGTAWIGKSPSDPRNPFNTILYDLPNYSMTVTSARNPFVYGMGFGLRTRVLGYFLRYDRAWGRIENVWRQPVNYWSLGFDF